MTIGSLHFSLPDLLQPPQIFLLDPASERTVQSDVSGVAVREQSWFDSGAAVFTDARSRALCSVRQTSRWSRAAGNLRQCCRFTPGTGKLDSAFFLPR